MVKFIVFFVFRMKKQQVNMLMKLTDIRFKLDATIFLWKIWRVSVVSTCQASQAALVQLSGKGFPGKPFHPSIIFASKAKILP